MSRTPEWGMETDVTLKVSRKLLGIWRNIANFRHTNAENVAKALIHGATKLEEKIEQEDGKLIYRRPDGTEFEVQFFAEGDWMRLDEGETE